MSTVVENLPSTSAPPVAAPTSAATGDPAILGLPIILAATGLGLIVSAVWAAALGQTMVACIFGLFSGFWWSYALLVLGLGHNWFAIPAGDVQHSVALFQISWAIVMAALTIATLRLPRAYTGVVALVVLALILLIIGTLGPSDTFTKLAGYVTFAFAALGGYLFLGAASAATGGPPYPLGDPLVR